MKKIAITSGDPAGIGPEIIGKGLRFYPLNADTAYIVYGMIDIPPGYRVIDRDCDLTGTMRDRNTVIKVRTPHEITKPGFIYNIETEAVKIKQGQPDKESGRIALKTLQNSLSDIKNYQMDALVTAPVAKDFISYHYPGFTGHTEYLADEFDTPVYVMNFMGEQFSMALLTTHCSLREVSKYVNKDFLLPKLRLISRFAQNLYGGCRIALLSMNPHGGESGLFGEEDDFLKEMTGELQQENINIEGPFPSDSFFKYKLTDYQQVIAVYHDQGLIPFKMINGEKGVNVTLGLPVVRTSVDHGTAFDIAGKDIASPASFISALQTAERLLHPHTGGHLPFDDADSLPGVPQTGEAARAGSPVALDTFETYSASDDRDTVHRPFRAFAPYYDDYMSHVDWDEWLGLIVNMVGKYVEGECSKVLDIGCGTGLMADKLAKCGYEVEAMDDSPQMLHEAALKNSAVKWIKGDFHVPLPADSYNLIVSLFDCINYINNKEEIAQLLANIETALQRGGLFIFDVSTRKNCREHFHGCVYVNETGDSYASVRAEFLNQYQQLEIDLFVKNGYFWKRFREEHILRIYDIQELIDIINNRPGLVIKGLYDLSGYKKLPEHDIEKLNDEIARVFFVIQKK